MLKLKRNKITIEPSLSQIVTPVNPDVKIESVTAVARIDQPVSQPVDVSSIDPTIVAQHPQGPIFEIECYSCKNKLHVFPDEFPPRCCKCGALQYNMQILSTPTAKEGINVCSYEKYCRASNKGICTWCKYQIKFIDVPKLCEEGKL